jgi:hypothetical protein
MVRHISVPGAKTVFSWGSQSPGADTVMVHVGSNDIMKGSSEQLKIDFKELIGSLLDTNKHPIISGPLPSIYRGFGGFSRLLSLHNCLRDLQLCGCNIY